MPFFVQPFHESNLSSGSAVPLNAEESALVFQHKDKSKFKMQLNISFTKVLRVACWQWIKCLFSSR